MGATLRHVVVVILLGMLGGPPVGWAVSTFLDDGPVVSGARGVLTEPVLHPGEPLQGEWLLTPLRGCQATWRRSLSLPDATGRQGTLMVPLPDIRFDMGDYVKIPPRQVRIPITPSTLPLDAGPGTGTYNVVGIYRCNHLGHWLKPIVQANPPIVFPIEPASGKGGEAPTFPDPAPDRR